MSLRNERLDGSLVCIADMQGYKIRSVNATMSTFAGTGLQGYAGDGEAP